MDSDGRDAPLWTELRWIIPLAAILLLLPPVVSLFDGRLMLFGLPVLPLYIFATWAVAIILCALTSRRTVGRSPNPDNTGP